VVMAGKPQSPAELDRLTRRALTIASRTAVAALGPGDDARDVAQEAALRVLERRDQLRDPEKFDAWAHRIATRETLRRLRQRNRRARSERSLDDHDEGVAALEPDLAFGVALRAAARDALEAIPERERLALVLRYVHDLSEPQIAAALGCRPGTAASLLS